MQETIRRAVLVALCAGAGFGAQAEVAIDREIPRAASGRPLLDVPGTQGLWLGGGSLTTPQPDERWQPWARAMYEYRRSHNLEPHARCKASGVIRQFLTPYGQEILDLPELERIYIFDIGGAHTYRTIYTDGRQHPADLQPSPFGHSVGWWEGDTLVVDSVGYDETFWLDRATPHTDSLRVMERFTRVSFDTIRYEVTLHDPKTFVEPVQVEGEIRFNEDRVHWEFICQANNYAPNLMLGHYEEVNRESPIVP